MRHRLLLLPVLVLVLLLAACDVLQEVGLGATDEAPAAATPTAVTAAPPEAITAVSVPITGTQTPEELALWLPPEVAVRTETGAAVLSEQLSTFNNAYPGVALRVQQKQVAGQGGIASYLRTASDVAPSILPDIVALPAGLVPSLASEGHIYPLDNLLDPGLLDALYPAAQQLVRVNDNVYAYPFALVDLPHLVYNTSVVTETLPLTWNQLIALPNRNLALATDGPDGALLGMQFYEAAGGRFIEEEGRVTLQQEPLTVALTQLQVARENGFILPASSTFLSQDEVWQALQSGSAPIVRTTADYFLANRTPDAPLGFTVTGGIDRPLTPYVDAWVLAVTTPDPARQALAAELISQLATVENLGAWSRESAFLPARRDALATWPEDAYVGFIQRELERAEAPPVAVSSRVGTVIGDAVFEVVSGSQTAATAAEEALETLAQ